jgi:hypothetical protein
MVGDDDSATQNIGTLSHGDRFLGGMEQDARLWRIGRWSASL